MSSTCILNISIKCSLSLGIIKLINKLPKEVFGESSVWSVPFTRGSVVLFAGDLAGLDPFSGVSRGLVPFLDPFSGASGGLVPFLDPPLVGLKGAYWIIQRFLVHYQILH